MCDEFASSSRMLNQQVSCSRDNASGSFVISRTCSQASRLL